MALAAETDNGDLPCLDEIQIGVAIVIDTHVRVPSLIFSFPVGGEPVQIPLSPNGGEG
jgi:hypothetical protein